MVVVRPPTPAWRAAAADEYIPDASDIKEQFWDQSFRQALRHNSRGSSTIANTALGAVHFASLQVIDETFRRNRSTSRLREISVVSRDIGELRSMSFQENDLNSKEAFLQQITPLQ